MTPMSLSGYLAEAHRHDLLREARQETMAMAMAAEATTTESGGIWDAALLVVDEWLLGLTQRLHARLSRKRLAQAYRAPRHVAGACHGDDALCSHAM